MRALLLLPCCFAGRGHGFLVIVIQLFTAVSHTVLKVDADMTIETVVNGGSAVGHSVHGSSVYISVIQDQNGPPPPAPGASVDALENSRVFRGAGLGIRTSEPLRKSYPS